MIQLSANTILSLLAKPEQCLQLSLSQWQQLIWVLREAKLLSALSAAVKRGGIEHKLPSYAYHHLQSAWVYAERQALQVRYECSQLQQLLSNAGITPLFLKGAAYTLAGTLNCKGRICNDLDVLVAKADLANAEALLQQHGWRTDKLSDYDERYYRQWSHEIPPMVHIHRGTVLDLHHNLYLPISGRAADMQQFFTLVQPADNAALVLMPAAMVLHSIIHLFTNEDTQSSLRDLWDLHLLISQFSQDAFWQQLTKLAQDTGFTTELRFCLAALQHYLASALDELTLQYGHQLADKSFWSTNVMLPALVPGHPYTCGWRNHLAKQMVYLRGHWIKMPARILCKHLTIKAFFAIRDQLFGKYQFVAKRPPNQHW